MPNMGTRYRIFGIGVDRKHTLKWLFPQEKATFHGTEKVYMYSENALVDSGLGAEFVEGADQLAGDLLGGGLLDDVALHEIDQLAVAEDGDGWGAGRVALKVAAGAFGGFAVLAGEDGDFVVGRAGGVAKSQTDARAHFAGCTAADGVDYEKGCARLGEGGVYVLSGAGFCDTGADKLFAHRDYHQFWVHFYPPAGIQPVLILT